MKLFECQHCGQMVYFENTNCVRCGYRLGYLPDEATLSALEPGDGDTWHALAAPDRPVMFCDNARHNACNWLVPTDGTETLCRACRHNRTVPDLSVPANLLSWQKI